MYPWGPWDFVPDTLWGTAILAFTGYIQSLIVWEGCA